MIKERIRMNRKTVTVVGIVFNIEETSEILKFLVEKNVFSNKEQEQFYNKLGQGQSITKIYNEIMEGNNCYNYPLMECVDSDLPNEYFLGYRIQEEAFEIPTNPKTLEYIKEAQDQWVKLFGDMPLTEAISFEKY